jgi:hypothetical protein
LRLDTLRETVRLVREARHGIPWRVNTNGLHGVEVAEALAEFAVDYDGRHPFVVSVMLAANTPAKVSRRFPLTPLRCWLFTPDLQWQSRDI